MSFQQILYDFHLRDLSIFAFFGNHGIDRSADGFMFYSLFQISLFLYLCGYRVPSPKMDTVFRLHISQKSSFYEFSPLMDCIGGLVQTSPITIP